jgi:hypothetical protein
MDMHRSEARAAPSAAKPTTPLSEAGMRTEPPVSEPMEISVPSPTDTPAPEDRPPGMRLASSAFPGVP